MNVLFRASVLIAAVVALGTQVLAEPVSRPNAASDAGRLVAAAFGGTDILLTKRLGQSDGDFRRACDKRDGLVTKREAKVVCITRMHTGSMRGSYGGGRARSLPDETYPPQASQPHV